MKQFRIFRALGLSFRVWLKNFIPFTLLAAMLYSPLWVGLIADDKLRPLLLMAPLRGVPLYMMIGLSTLLTPLRPRRGAHVYLSCRDPCRRGGAVGPAHSMLA